MIDQAGWGSTKLYPDGGLSGTWQPEYIVIHWGGNTSQVSPADEDNVLRGWQRYHLGRGWRDIAYQYAVGDSGNMYRLRGENPGGATTGTAPNGLNWNATGVSIVWIGGLSDVNGPSVDAIATLVQYLDSRGLPVLGHVNTGKATQCPGQDLLQFIDDYNNGEYTMEDAPNIDECKSWQVEAWKKAQAAGLLTVDSHPLETLNKGDLMVFLDRAKLL